jgi:methyl-accepting chemotaxis protein
MISSDTRISTKLALGFGVLALLILTMGGVSLVKTTAVGAAFQLTTEDRYGLIHDARDVKDELNAVATATRNVLLLQGPDDIKKEEERIAAARTHISQLLKHLEDNIQTAQGKAVFAKVVAARAQYVADLEKLLPLIAAHSTEEAASLLMTSMRQTQLAYMAALDGLIELQEGLMTQSKNDTASDIGTLKLTIVGCGLLSLAAALFMGTWITRSITAPIREAVEVSRRWHVAIWRTHHQPRQNETGQRW